MPTKIWLVFYVSFIVVDMCPAKGSKMFKSIKTFVETNTDSGFSNVMFVRSDENE